MITDIYIALNDNESINRIKDLEKSFTLYLYDERTTKGKKDGLAIRNKWASRQVPFAICYDLDKPVKAFYSETGEDVINNLIDFVNGSRS